MRPFALLAFALCLLAPFSWTQTSGTGSGGIEPSQSVTVEELLTDPAWTLTEVTADGVSASYLIHGPTNLIVPLGMSGDPVVVYGEPESEIEFVAIYTVTLSPGHTLEFPLTKFVDVSMGDWLLTVRELHDQIRTVFPGDGN